MNKATLEDVLTEDERSHNIARYKGNSTQLRYLTAFDLFELGLILIRSEYGTIEVNHRFNIVSEAWLILTKRAIEKGIPIF